MKYYVNFYSVTAAFEVEADSREQAIQAAKQLLIEEVDNDIRQNNITCENQG